MADRLIDIRLLGPMTVLVEGRPIRGVRSRKTLLLLALLALRPCRQVSRDWIAASLWPESSKSQGLDYLRHALSELRQALGTGSTGLTSEERGYLLLDTTGVSVDVSEFDESVCRGDPESLRVANTLYTGPLLEGFEEEWVLPERRSREQTLLQALDTLAAFSSDEGDNASAVTYLRRSLAIDPFREASLRALMGVLAARGEYPAAISAFRELRLLLHRELNAEPSPETTTLFRKLLESARSGSGPVGARSETASQGREDLRSSPGRPARFESAGGAVPLDSSLYVTRKVDQGFRSAIASRDSIVLVKGARQIGKTSLLARGLQEARDRGAAVAVTDFQALNASHLASADAVCLALANVLALELDLVTMPVATWNPDLGASLNLDWYIREHVFPAFDGPIVWGLDEVDRLFGYEFGGEIFGLFRSWHNRRALDPGPWSRLSLAIAYSTEARLFITDLNQSPFNVGTRLELEPFEPSEVGDLNQRYGNPLRTESEVQRLHSLLGGQPYLTRSALFEIAVRERSLADLEAVAAESDGPFGDHLERMLLALSRGPELADAIRAVLRGERCPAGDEFWRLRSAGLLIGKTRDGAQIACRLYETFLKRALL